MMGEEIARYEYVRGRQKYGYIPVGVGRGLREQLQLFCADIDHQRLVEGNRRPGRARRGRNVPRQRRHMLVRRKAPAAIGMTEDRRACGTKSGVAVGMIEMPVSVDDP